MVTWVVPVSSFPAEHLDFFLSLDTFRASSDTASWDTVADEAVVVAAAVERNEGVVESLIFIPLDIQVTQLFRSIGIESVGGIVNLVCEVGAVFQLVNWIFVIMVVACSLPGHHVVVHEETDLGILFLCQ